MNINVLTTLPHYICYFLCSDYNYALLISVATTLSVLHHMDEKNDFILFLDLTIAGIWGIVDLTINKYTIILNLITAFLYLKIYHPCWHIISVVKSIVVIFYFLENK